MRIVKTSTGKSIEIDIVLNVKTKVYVDLDLKNWNYTEKTLEEVESAIDDEFINNMRKLSDFMDKSKKDDSALNDLDDNAMMF